MSLPTSSLLTPGRHRHRRLAAVSGDFDLGLGLMPPPVVPERDDELQFHFSKDDFRNNPDAEFHFPSVVSPPRRTERSLNSPIRLKKSSASHALFSQPPSSAPVGLVTPRLFLTEETTYSDNVPDAVIDLDEIIHAERRDRRDLELALPFRSLFSQFYPFPKEPDAIVEEEEPQAEELRTPPCLSANSSNASLPLGPKMAMERTWSNSSKESVTPSRRWTAQAQRYQLIYNQLYKVLSALKLAESLTDAKPSHPAMATVKRSHGVRAPSQLAHVSAPEDAVLLRVILPTSVISTESEADKSTPASPATALSNLSPQNPRIVVLEERSPERSPAERVLLETKIPVWKKKSGKVKGWFKKR